MTGGTVEKFGLLLLIAASVATIARRLRLPYTVGLVIAGVAVGFLPLAAEWTLTRELLFSTLLPPLVFEAALNIRWRELRANLTPILMFATVGLGLSAVVVTGGMALCAGWPISVSVVFGVLLSATDPVSVVATMKDAKTGGRLRLLLEAESLLNDGTAAVGFAVAVTAVMGATLTPLTITWEFIRMAGGGIICGGLVSAFCLFLAGKTDDSLVEIAFSVVCAFASFLVAETLHTSGILATVVAGLVFGNLGHFGLADQKGQETLVNFWEFAAFLANSFVFLLMGLRLSHTKIQGPLVPILVAVPLVLVGRAVSVYGISQAFRASKHQVPLHHQHVIVWGGIRGALSLALALGLPEGFPHVEEVRLTTFCVVVFSVLVQGVTIRPLLSKTGEPVGAKP